MRRAIHAVSICLLLILAAVAYADVQPKLIGRAKLGNNVNTSVCTNTNSKYSSFYFVVHNYAATTADGVTLYFVTDNATIDNTTIVYQSRVSPLSAYGGYFVSDYRIPFDRDNATLVGLDNRTSGTGVNVSCYGAQN